MAHLQVLTKPLVLYYDPRSSNSLRVSLYLKEKGLPFETKEIDLFQKENKTEEFKKINPRQQVPVLIDGDIIIHESVAIIEYLEHSYKGNIKLLPDDKKEQAHALELICEYHQKLDTKSMFGSVAFQKMKKEDLKDKIIAWNQELSFWEDHLKGRDYFLSHLSIVDFIVLPNFWVASLLGKKYDKYPNLNKWFQHMTNRDSFKESNIEKLWKDFEISPVLAD